MKKIISVLTAVLMIAALFVGCGKAPDDVPETGTTELTNPPAETSAETFDGWWVISPNYYEGVIPVVSIFSVDTEAEQWTPYDRMGNPGDTMSCSFPDESTIVLDMGAMGEQEMYLEDGILYYIDDDHEAYIHTEDPGFVQLDNYAGTWNFMGDPTLGVSYELTEDQAKKTENGQVTLEGPYETNLQRQCASSGAFIAEVPYMEQEWPAPGLYPSADGLYLIERDTFRNNVYVRDGASIPEQLLNLVDMLINSDFAAPGEDDSCYLKLIFGTGTYRIITMRAEDENGYSQDTSAEEICGTWELDQELVLHITGENAQDLDLADWAPEAALQIGDMAFTLQYYNSYE